MDKATSVRLTLNSAELPTTSQDLPIYLGVGGCIGGQWIFLDRFSLFSEVRLQVIANQSPVIYGIEAAGGLLYWP